MYMFDQINEFENTNLIELTYFLNFVCIIPLNVKTAQEVSNALSRILKERISSKMWVGKGRKLYNKDVQILVPLYSAENEEKSCEIERCIRTIENKMF